MRAPLLPLIAPSHTVIAPDPRGAGDSERTAQGYDKKTMAQDINDEPLQRNAADGQPGCDRD